MQKKRIRIEEGWITTYLQIGWDIQIKTKLHNKYYVNYYVSIIYQNLNPMYLLKS